MKIIHHGTAPKKHPWMGRWECPHCYTIIELEESDQQTMSVVYICPQFSASYVMVLCPVCKVTRNMYVAPQG